MYGVVGLVIKHGFDCGLYLFNLVVKGLCSENRFVEAEGVLGDVVKVGIMPDY